MDIVRHGKGHGACEDKANVPCKRYKSWAREVAQQTKVAAAQTDDLSSNLGTHMVKGEN